MPTVTVRTIDNIMDKSGRKTWLEPAGGTVMSYCPERFADAANLAIVKNGEAMSRENAKHAHAYDGDEVIFFRKPRLEFAALLIVGIVISLISYQVQALTAPTVRGQKKDLEDSETYGFGGIVNTVTPGTRIPIIYGTHRVGGQIVQQFQTRKAIRNPTDLNVGFSGAEVNSLIGVCSGPIDNISSLRVNKNPRLPGQGPVLRWTRGTNNQAPITGFNDIRTQVTKDASVTGVGGSYITQTQSEVDAFSVLFRFSGLFRTSDRGQFLQKSVDIRIEYKEVGTPNYTLTATTVSASQRNQFDIEWRSPDLPRAKYDIRITRLTPDDTTATGISDFNVFAIVEILDDTQTYPGVALYGLSQGPSALVSGSIPTYDVLVRGKLVRIYTNLTTYTVQWSDNPAFCLLDFLTDKKYGLGAFIDDDRIDLQSFLDAAAFCISEGFTLNIVLDGSLNAFDAIRQMCMAGRLLFCLRGDKWTVRPDKPEEPVQFFSMGRIMKGSFTAAKQSKADKANYLIGEFLNAELDYERDSLPKEDPTLAIGEEQVETTINLTGVTNSAQANKLLNQMMLSNRLQTRTVEFDVGIEAIAMEAGDVFAVSHEVPAWGLSGQIREVDETGTTLWLDRKVTLEVGKEYEVTVFHDKHEGDPTTRGFNVVRVTNNPEITDRLFVSGDWTDIPTKGFDYSFGELTKSYVKYRCVGITRGTAVGKRRVRGIEYNEAVYGDDLTVLPSPSVSALPNPLAVLPDVTELRLSERTVYAEDGTLSTAIDVFFNLPIAAGVRAAIFWREAGLLAWGPVGEVNSGFGTITQNVRSPGVTYEVAVASVSSFGVRKEPEECPWASITTVGVTRQPDNVSNFRADRTMEGLVFTWDAVNPSRNFDLANYEIRAGELWETGITIGEPKETRFTTTAFVKGENTYLIKAKNTAGKFSPLPQAVVIEVDARINENIVYTRQEEPTFPGSKEAFIVEDDKLKLNTDDQVVAWRNDNTTTSLGSSKYIPGGRKPGFRVKGTYMTDKFQITSGNAETALVSYMLVAEQIDTSTSWNAADVASQSWQSEFAKTRAWSVAPDGKVKIVVEMRFSTLTSAEADFGPWQERAQNISVQVKWAQARIHVEIVDPAFTVEIPVFEIMFDVPDRRDAGSDTTSAAGNITVNFARPFNNAPRVVCTIQSASAGDDIVRGAATNTGFTLSVFNGGVRVVRTVEYVAVGF